ncbi:Npun_R1517 family heterocyst differentiation transcriptional regulator [Leptolyngbya sp. FACHB-671]|uniref:Npun_R1517 family heterocyst differentiation transcriptional regulator n=1 Tax=unclassified Leptolyngbya TaxID=2650499 RepID=UPI001686C79B|nr:MULTISPECIES: Npun_R1517 family heterocyst differentiation transcriptional regulator [unclassified Leptolyngbya]MBD1871048.1 Npun_R1517 family heterocyst differentiation transcriptional regulator [Cyanobacteria bacterium FACHB-471]MBD2001257.1 Npun_R1517 family heterocyst differentiation transcriptional regulator [Leptolyngbya sp. FACHB-541]MBD2070770.1 Npun_R1517 family heterocyst differentiation transcriptional regulator [Leptolyngbya sp. FACHB-671]
MKSSSLEYQPVSTEVGVYDCEIRLKFRLIEEKGVLCDREELLEMLLDAFTCGADEYLEPVQIHVEAKELPEVEASPQMRRQLIRLRNSSDLA